MPSSRKTPPWPALLSYETAASLQHIMLAAYVGIERDNPQLYAEITAQTKRFFEDLSAYLDKHS